MKSKSIVALAIAGVFSCAGALAGGAKHGSLHHGSGAHHSVEVSTPSSVNESAPWLAGKPHLNGWTARSSDSTMLGMNEDLSSDGSQPFYVVNVTEYWLIGEAPSDVSSAVGSTSSTGSGFGGFDSSGGSFGHSFDGGTSSGFDHSSGLNGDLQSFADSSGMHEIVVYTPAAEAIYQSVGEGTPLLSEHYLVPFASSAYDTGNFLVLAIAPTAEDLALLDSLKEDFYILTPSYGEG